MITYVTGDIFQSDAVALVNTINTEGIVGKGIASHFKRRYPNNFKACERACTNGEIQIGHVFPYTENESENKRIIINFPTKKLWKDKSNLHEITMGLEDLASVIRELNIPSIAIPPLGCGLGGLKWEDVKAAMERIFAPLTDVNISVFEPIRSRPNGGERHKDLGDIRRSVLAMLFKYMQITHSSDISFIETHNLLYFIQTFGLDLKLKFAPYCYGVYCNNLDTVLYGIEGEWVQRFKEHPTNSFETFRFTANANIEDLAVAEEYKDKSEKTFAFIHEYENPLGIELLASIHWLVFKENCERDVLSIQNGIQNWCSKNNQHWGERKRYYFTPDILDKAVTRINTFFPETK
ncbi:MAG: macro domain-containing protein [Desulfovibrionaceae bacterium]|nr:macro domain-containing protein [Desulfovibrionaceae bacterium]